MSAKLAIGAFVMMCLLTFIVIFAYQFGLQGLGATDMGVNLTGTQYQSAYNASINTSIVAYSFVSWEGIIIGAVALVFLMLILAAAFIKR